MIGVDRRGLIRAAAACAAAAAFPKPAIAQGNAPKEATVKILEYKEMAPFFVKGESGEP